MPDIQINHYGDALRAIQNKPFLSHSRYQEQQWRANREGAHVKILEFADAFVRRFHNLGVPMFPHCIVRTPEDQQAAYVTGRSKVKGSDPYPHRFAAVDLIHGNLGWNLEKRSWDMVGHVGKEVAAKLGIQITWGGDWDFYDPAHWELAFWRSMDPSPPHMWNGGVHLRNPNAPDDIALARDRDRERELNSGVIA